MRQPPKAGYVYILTHVAWAKIGLVKIGMTSRDPLQRAREITSVSGLIAPCRLEWCIWVEDRRAVEAAVHRALNSKRVSRRELFRTDVATAQAAILSASCRKSSIQWRRDMKRLIWVGVAAVITLLGTLIFW